MDDHAYNVLPIKFRKAFEEVNGEIPESEFIRAIWMDIAMKWFGGWCLAIEHADELRPPIQTLTAPAPTRTFVLTVTPGELPMIQEPKLPGSAQTEAMHVPMREYVSSLEDYRPENNVFQQEANPWPVPPPPMPAPRQGHAPAAPVTAAEAAAASVEPKKFRRFIIVRASDNPSNNWRWLVQITDTELVKYGSYASADDAAKALDAMENTEQRGSIYFISDAQLRYWQQNPQLGTIPRESVE